MPPYTKSPEFKVTCLPTRYARPADPDAVAVLRKRTEATPSGHSEMLLTVADSGGPAGALETLQLNLCALGGASSISPEALDYINAEIARRAQIVADLEARGLEARGQR
jgi:hypothetical protein